MNAKKTGELIATIRKEQGCTQQALANRIGVSSAAISKWERGIGFPDASLIETLASSLNITIAELYAGERNIEEKEYINNDFKCQQEAKWLFFLFTLIIYVLLSIITQKWGITWGIWIICGIYRMLWKEIYTSNREKLIGWGLYILSIITLPLLSASSIQGIAPYFLIVCICIMAGLGIKIMGKNVKYPRVFKSVLVMILLLGLIYKVSRTANLDTIYLVLVGIVFAYIVLRVLRTYHKTYIYDWAFVLSLIFTAILFVLLSYVVFSPFNQIAYWAMIIGSTMLYSIGVYWLSNYIPNLKYEVMPLFIMYLLAIYIENSSQYMFLISNVTIIEVGVFFVMLLCVSTKKRKIYSYVPFYLAVFRVVLLHLDNPNSLLPIILKCYGVVTISFLLFGWIEREFEKKK